jgi:hypothetical protein
MFEHSKLYLQIIIEAVAKLTTGQVALARYKPALGALIMARFPDRREPDRAIVERIEASILRLPQEEQATLLY